MERDARLLAPENRGDLDWQDLMHSALLRALESLDHFDGSCPAAAWLLKNYRWGLLDALRSMSRPWDKKRHRSGIRWEVPIDTVEIEAPPQISEVVSLLKYRARRRSARHEFIVEQIVQGQLHRDIAADLQISPGRLSQLCRELKC